MERFIGKKELKFSHTKPQTEIPPTLKKKLKEIFSDKAKIEKADKP